VSGVDERETVAFVVLNVMQNTMHLKLASESDDLLDPANRVSDKQSAQASIDAIEEIGEKSLSTTGILPAQELEYLARVTKEILSPDTPISDDQFQPASLDLRLGAVAYRVRASFLPGKQTVREKLNEFAMHEMDITNGGVLERGCVYIVPLLEHLALKYRMSARGNPKSSTGRLDIFTRLITDYGTEFDTVREQYKGPLYAEVSPRTFSVLVRKGSRLSQLRIRRGKPLATDESMRRLLEEHQIVDSASGEDVRDGVPVTVDVLGESTGGLIGYRAKSHTGLIDIDRVRHYEVSDFWEPVYAPRGGLVLDPADFYILASREAVRVPPTYAAEMIAYDTLVGEFRVHYAGFFDPGFGHADANGEGSRAVLEVRSYEVPFVIEHGQTVGRLAYERLAGAPNRLYGAGVKSNYQGQGIALSKHFIVSPPR
jgi:dCTP deaminase